MKNHARCLETLKAKADTGPPSEMLDTSVGQSKKADPADFARDGFDTLMSGEASVVSAFRSNGIVRTIRNRSKSKCWSKLLSKKSINFFKSLL